MDKQKLSQIQDWVRDELDRCVNFWLKNGMDTVNGGFLSLVDALGMPPEAPQ